MNFEFDNNSPIYMQIVEKIKFLIISGRLNLGSKLPSVREFAAEAKVNPNTIQKALSELEEMGLIFTERTNGKYVTLDGELIMDYKKVFADELSEKYVKSMQELGFSKLEIMKHLNLTEAENEIVRMH